MNISTEFISCHSRKAYIDEFFKNENEAASSSLSGHGFLKFCNKSDLATCLDSLFPSKKDPLDVNTNILDGLANGKRPFVIKNGMQVI